MDHLLKNFLFSAVGTQKAFIFKKKKKNLSIKVKIERLFLSSLVY